jgi:hypothetical protein
VNVVIVTIRHRNLHKIHDVSASSSGRVLY